VRNSLYWMSPSAGGPVPSCMVAALHTLLENVPDVVSAGDELIGTFDGDATTTLYEGRQGRSLGRVTDADFARAFFSIWLHERRFGPQLLEGKSLPLLHD
jgi:hypothetical protein